MDLLGKISRRYLGQCRAARMAEAQDIAEGLLKEGMNKAQLEEILCSYGFEEDLVKEVVDGLAQRR